MADTPAESIVDTLLKVMADTGAVGKDDVNQQQRFNFRGVDAVVNAVSPAMRKHGLVAIPKVLDHETEHGTTRNGAHMVTVRLMVQYTWINRHGDSLETIVRSEASDMSDKATAKAMSVALRIAYLQTLALPTDEKDPDAEYIERGNGQPSQPQPSVPDNWRDYVASAKQRGDVGSLKVMAKQARSAGENAIATEIESEMLALQNSNQTTEEMNS